MATISKKFDVKINVIYPHISRSIPSRDSSRIRETNFFKYEPQKSVASTPSGVYVPSPQEAIAQSRLVQLENRLDNLADNFKRLEEYAEKSLKDLVYQYDIDSSTNEFLANAERAVFGVATGSITYDQYKSAKELEEVVNEIIQERMIENQGVFNVG